MHVNISNNNNNNNLAIHELPNGLLCFHPGTENALLLLQSVDAKVAAIQAGLGALMRANITDLHFALSATLNDWSCIGCDGTCTGCQPIVVGDIYYQTDFDKVC